MPDIVAVTVGPGISYHVSSILSLDSGEAASVTGAPASPVTSSAS
ncbi:hypothetical protein [Streptomyces indiaensis]|uniref:Uncharacterized protein n=1 Tax=Streptomyces indiaensis TaxID=284033 RepID=A0ABN3DT91_9ACTN|nr:hypothetical protein [Streptomyces indiaensis]